VEARRIEHRDGTEGRHGGVADRLLTAEELAYRWQVPKSHVYRLSREGRIPTVKLGKYYRYRLDAIAAWEVAHGEPA
jgi:excisionase family DNA binding protein